MSRENKKETLGSLFLSMFLKAGVVIMGILIVVFGIVYFVQLSKLGNSNNKSNKTGTSTGVEDKGNDELLGNTGGSGNTESTETPPEGTGNVTTEAVPQDATGSRIAVLNSTEIGGLAGAWCMNLNDRGYSDCTASDFSEPYTNTRIVAKQDGLGRELVDYFNGATYEVGTLSGGSEEDLSQYDVVIIIGTSDDIVSGQE